MKYERIACILLLLVISLCDAKVHPAFIKSYVYGHRVPGEQVAYQQTGEIPDLLTIYTHVIKDSDLMPGMNKNFTYLQLEYVSPMSKVDVRYIPETYTVEFLIAVPFMTIEYGIVAYAIKKR